MADARKPRAPFRAVRVPTHESLIDTDWTERSVIGCTGAKEFFADGYYSMLLLRQNRDIFYAATELCCAQQETTA